MPWSAVPALVGIVLLLLVGLLAALAEWHEPAARWFALFNLCLAATSALGLASTSTPHGARDLALWLGKLANFSASLAFAAFFLQLAALGRSVAATAVVRLRRLAPAVVLATVGVGAVCLATRLLVREVRWQPESGYGPIFGSAVPLVLALLAALFGWAALLMAALHRHGSARLRREVRWIAVGVLLFDVGGLVLLAIVLPRLGAPTLRWASSTLAAGSAVMLGAMVLTRQREIEQRDSSRSWGRRPQPSVVSVHSEPASRACVSCGGMLTPRSDMVHCPLDGGAIRDGIDPWPGRTLDERFAVEALVGAGAMGRVYRARDLRRGTAVALKLLDVNLAADARTCERFAREARSAMRIRSPHVVVVYDVGQEPPGLPYLTMELIEGPSLRALLSGGRRLSAPSVARLGAELARGLAAAHAQNVVHRDLKPDNVLVALGAEADIVKIVDFGLAKMADEPPGGSELTTLGRVLGTPAYLSPEQARGQPAGPRSDVYALGVLLYRARSGRKPFAGPTLALLARHISEPPAPLGDGPLDRLILGLLDKEPGDRPDAADLIERFAALADGCPRLVVEATGEEPRTAQDPASPTRSDSEG
jgi:serine/threonine-protein kinase